LFACLHHSYKATDPVDLLSVRGAKLPEERQQLFGGFPLGLDLLFDLLRKASSAASISNKEQFSPIEVIA
jgi:hypothetical protein